MTDSRPSRPGKQAMAGAIRYALATLAIAAPPAMAAPPTDLFRDQVDRFIESEMKSEQVPGAAVAVIHKGQVVIAKGYGRATVEFDVPVTTDTMFQSGSVGKMFTAAAVMLQVEQGKMRLDDPVSKYLPGAPASWRAMTVRHLMTHTSGVANLDGAFYGGKDFSDETYIAQAFAKPLDFAPGARWNYSNTGYALLGILVKKATGHSYLDVLAGNVFKPLGMATARPTNDSDIVPNRAAGYKLAGGVLKNQDFSYANTNPTGDGALYLSLKDMIAWNRGIEHGKVLSAAGWQQAWTPVRLNSGKPYPYGFGWSVTQAGGAPHYHHGGAWQGFKTYYSRYPGDELAIIILTNSGATDVEKLNNGIAALWDAKLTAPPPKPRPEPAIAHRIAALIETARSGGLTPQDVPLFPADYIPMFNARMKDLLSTAGALKSLDLVERAENGDDIDYVYAATFAGRGAKVRYGVAPGNQATHFTIE
ncbi:serine hydrolase domain-containing protein [Sphingomonas colocasiae]|uniref:Beta-lactamase family protein n=1 Tax=Sphingomonas colocasiae TaxID=1848973 RepID=A0ABS7PXY8_9SPHN|nr:serine hydrolase domain-containing protein [Sphingomonas colocasiae]MBY8826227.1 beta-lactamase family protein [Sphingomonas colocasiae]